MIYRGFKEKGYIRMSLKVYGTSGQITAKTERAHRDRVLCDQISKFKRLWQREITKN
jgi:hypothetical protein